MKYLKFLIFMVLALFVVIAIPYRFIWPFAPPWLDAVVYGGAGLGLLAGLSKRGGKKGDDNIRRP